MSFFDSGIPSEIDFEKKLKIKKKCWLMIYKILLSTKNMQNYS